MILIDYLQRIMREKNLSGADIANQSTKNGNKGVSRGYISKLLNYDHINLTVTSLCSIAAGIGRPEVEIFNAARGIRPDLTDEETRVKERVWDIFSRLPPEQRSIFDAILDGFAQAGAGIDPIAENDAT